MRNSFHSLSPEHSCPTRTSGGKELFKVLLKNTGEEERGHPEVVPDLEPDLEPENVQLHCLTIQNITMIMVANLGVLWWKILLKNIHGWKDQGSFKFVWIDWLHADGMQYLKWLLRHHSQSWTLNCHKGCEILLEFWFD